MKHNRIHPERAKRDPLFPPGFPWWAVMVIFMIASGYFQSWVRNQFYWYKEKMAAQPHLALLSEEERAGWWHEERMQNPGRYQEVNDEVAHFLDRWNHSEIVALDFALMFLFMLLFFVLDALFLRACDAKAQLPFLKLIYIVVGATLGIMLVIKQIHPTVWDIDGGLLPFLMSPMPSFLLVLFPWMLRQRTKG